MLNYIWFALMAIALIVAAINGTAGEVTKGALESAKTAVDISLGLVGVMALWLGIMKIADRAGLIKTFARVVAPVARMIFPDVPPDHPAMGSMILNMAANMLGLSNAATPFGIKAMEELQTLNNEPDTATNAMVMFMSVNTVGLQLIPATAMAVLVTAGSTKPTAIIGTTIIATSIGTVAAITAARTLQIFFPVSKPADPAPGNPTSEKEPAE